MSQNPKPFATLETELADNTSKAITPLNLRNFLESALGCYGSLYTEGGVTTEGLTGTLAKVDTWLSAGTASNTTPDPTNNQLTIDAEGVYLVEFNAQYLGAAASDQAWFELRNNNVVVVGARCVSEILVAQRDTASFKQVVSLSVGDDLSIYAKAVGGVGDVTIENAQLIAARIG